MKRAYAGIVAGCLIAQASAGPVGLADRRVQLSLGTFLNRPRTDIRADGPDSEGTPIVWGATFGDDRTNRFRLDAYWRFQPHHHLRLMHTDYSRSRDAGLDQEIEWNGQRLPAGVMAEGTLGFNIVELAYEYDLARSPDTDLSLSIGAHWMAFEAEIAASGAPAGQSGTSLGSKVSMHAPLPALGVRGMWHLGANFYFNAQVQYFALATGRYQGHLLNYRGALIWQPKWIGVGVGYDSFAVDVNVNSDPYRGRLDWRYGGPQAFLNVAF